MCGIVGVYHYRGGRALPDLIRAQAAVLSHRGPDDEGVWCEGSAGLGHRRLSIVDPGPGGHQPMSNEDGSLWLTVNGELYGWRDIRRRLIARRHRFRGASDAEIVLHLYEDEGDELMSTLRGEFAFALYDCTSQRLLIARDRVGVKPLYYHDNGERLTFASELKALLLDPSVPREVDEQAIAEFLMFQYVPAARTIWKGVRKLPPGHLLTCDERGVRCKRYWSLPVGPPLEGSEAEYGERLRLLLDESVRLRMIADVPVGAFLSGGIDSSAVVALMTRVSSCDMQTFCVGFEEQDFSEIRHARRVAMHLGTTHHEFIVRPRALEVLPHLIWGLDEPFADASIIPTYYVAQMARGLVKTVLSGDGGDEVFAGYKTYGAARTHERLRRIPSALRYLIGTAACGLRHDSALGRKIRRVPMSILDRHLEAMSSFPPLELQRILSSDLRRLGCGSGFLASLRRDHLCITREIGEVPALLHFDANTYLPDDVLKKVDTASMLNSLEVRIPLLDHELIEFVARIPFEYKMRGRTSKWILKSSVKDLLPPQVLQRAKKGFTVPLKNWFDGGFRRLAQEALLDARARRRGWLNTQEVGRLVRGDAGYRGRTGQLWTLVCLELWAQCYLDGAPTRALVGLILATPGLYRLVREAQFHFLPVHRAWQAGKVWFNFWTLFPFRERPKFLARTAITMLWFLAACCLNGAGFAQQVLENHD